MSRRTASLGAAAAAALAAAILAFPVAAGAVEPAQRFNLSGQRHADACMRLATVPGPLRFGDGTATGFTLNDGYTFDEDGRCPAGTVRLDLHEVIPNGGGQLVFHRGGNGYVGGQNVKYGELFAHDVLPPLPPPTPSSGGRGAPCPLSGEAAHEVDVESIPEHMHYKSPDQLPSGTNRGTSFEHYGDPGADQGDRHDIHYSYLLWSFLNARGGGMVRTLLAPGQVVRPCDVESVTMDAWERDGGVNGRVTARYVRTLAGSCPVYGWMVWTHDDFGDAAGPVSHASPAASPPPADPAPDPACPVAEGPQPPLATTESATATDDGTATLTGTINPKGVSSSYRFDFGPESGFTGSTPPDEISAADRVSTVSAQVTGLVPGRTYRYRMVATSAYAETLGPDRLFTVPLPPPPVLSNLSASPSTFRRTRSRRGWSTRIRYTLSKAGAVTLKFERRTVGVRRGGECRRPRGGRIPRGARRCGLWVKVHGVLRVNSPAGKTKLKFGGWIGRKPLPRGSYRLRAFATASGSRPSKVRNASFRLR